MSEKKITADRLIEDWIAERGDLAAHAEGEPQDQRLLELLSVGLHAPVPLMSEAEATHVLSLIPSQTRAAAARSTRSRSSGLLSAAAAALAVVLALWSTNSTPPAKARQVAVTPIKHVLFETVSQGKVVRFEMRVFRSSPAEVSNERAR